MGTNPVNLVDAIGTVVPRLARNRSAVLRFGKVSVAPAAGLVTVLIGTTPIQANYLGGVLLMVNDWVCLINDGDKWIVLGKVIPASGLLNAHVMLGDPANGNAYGFYTDRLIDGVGVRAALTATSEAANGAGVYVYVGGVLKTEFVVDQLGQLTVLGPDSVFRPLPWAMQAISRPVTVNNAVSGTVAITFDTGRFKVAPVVSLSTENNGNYFCYLVTGTITANGFTAGIRHFDNATATVTHTVHAVAVQMSSTTGPGLRVVDTVPEGLVEKAVICRTGGCVNDGVPLVMRLLPETTDILCGPCGQPATDAPQD